MQNVNGQTVESPWLTRTQAAAYARRHPQTIWLALCEYQRTSGASGLKGSQPVKGGHWSIHREDLDRWISRTVEAAA